MLPIISLKDALDEIRKVCHGSMHAIACAAGALQTTTGSWVDVRQSLEKYMNDVRFAPPGKQAPLATIRLAIEALKNKQVAAVKGTEGPPPELQLLRLMSLFRGNVQIPLSLVKLLWRVGSNSKADGGLVFFLDALTRQNLLQNPKPVRFRKCNAGLFLLNVQQNIALVRNCIQ